MGKRMKKDVKAMLIQYIADNQAKFYRLAYSYTHEREADLDIVQNSIVKALEKYHTIRNTNAIKTWFYRVIVNESLRYLQKSGRELYGPEDFLDLPADACEEALKDLLGENYIEIANQQILEEMQVRMRLNENITYWGEDMDGFTTIGDDTNFYINGAGNAVVVFSKYEVAPGFMGAQEFEILK